MNKSLLTAVPCYLFALAFAGVYVGQSKAQDKPAAPIILREALVIEPVGKSGRVPVYVDFLVADIVAGKWQAPREGDTLQIPNGPKRTWKKMTADKSDWFNGQVLFGGYAFCQVESDSDKVMLLEAQGHLMVYVNGEPRIGDVYSHGYVKIPVLLKKGKNDLLFHVGRGKLNARLTPIKSEIFFNTADMLLPDFLVGEGKEKWASVVVVNASQKAQRDVFVKVEDVKGNVLVKWVEFLPPLCVHKVGFQIPAPDTSNPAAFTATITLRQKKPTAPPLESIMVKLQVRKPTDSHKRTFISKIDGSVQYYAVRPAVPLKKGGPPPALVLSLHGAAVEATGQADSYGAKTWAHIVAPTNRRPFGFDWEDWGRLDAMEVLAQAQQDLQTDPQRTYLTGHSMGGHGAWHIGATYPSKFAAIGPSAGWLTFWTYGAKKWEENDPLYPLIDRASNPSDTIALARNFAQHGVYILHGDADDNVPVAQARAMKKLLEPFHKDLHYFEQPKAGHWWDAHPEPGTDCVDWAAMFDLFAKRAIPLPEAVRELEFVTMNPGISAWSHWVGIEAQKRHFQASSVKLRFDPGLRQFSGTTDNVARIAFDLSVLPPGKALHVELDGQKIKDIAWPEKDDKLWLESKDGKWGVSAKPQAAGKGPHRYGPFRDVFNNQMLFVYGTKGTPAENAWAYAKARFDAESFWYQGNGSIEMIADTDFDAGKDKDRNVILYGNADTNGAWKTLLGDSPVQVHREHVQAGKKKIAGKDLACLFLQPRPGSDVASVGVVSGTILHSMKLTDRLRFFISGAGYPDFILYGPELPTKGYGGVLGAGYFGLDWGVESGEFVWRGE